MPKKSRRAKAKRRAMVVKATREERSQEPRSVPAEAKSPARVSVKSQDLSGRYRYVMPELRRIGIIAGVMILVLIVLSFFLG
ncbi:MAG: hypothetical protein ACXQTH_03260 [Dehalococcoidia bacterium]